MIFRTTNNVKKQPWQCPGCDMYYAPHVDSCDCDEKWEEIWSDDPFATGTNSPGGWHNTFPDAGDVEININPCNCASDSN